MGFFDFLPDLGGIFGGDDGGGLGGGVVDAALSAEDYLDNEFFGQTAATPVSMVPTARSAPRVPMPLLPSGMITRGLAQFPSLLSALQMWRGRGVTLTVSKLGSMMRKFGPNFLVSAGILTAAAVTDLLMYNASHKRRRMNPLNPRALSRATRRLCSFEHRAGRVHQQLFRLARRGKQRKGVC